MIVVHNFRLIDNFTIANSQQVKEILESCVLDC